MGAREDLIAEASQYCDVRERLARMPEDAALRGLHFRSIERAVKAAGIADRYNALFPERFAALAWYPAPEFMVRMVVAAALVATPERVHDGMYEVGRYSVSSVRQSLIGTMLIGRLSPDPKLLLQQGLAGRRQTINTGRWRLTLLDDTSARMDMAEEFFYIESYLLGAAHGTFEAIGLELDAQAVLEDRFNGSHLLRWRQPEA